MHRPMHRGVRTRAVPMLSTILLCAALLSGRAEAIAIQLMPAATNVAIGDAFSIDVIVSDLHDAGEIVSAFDLDLLYDANLLSATGVSFSALLGAPDVDAFGGGVFTPGRIDFANVSLLTNAELLALQSDSFVLASLSFNALGAGVASLLFDALAPPGLALVGLDPFANLPLDHIGAAVVTVTAPTSVPEPGSLGLLALGLLGLLARRSPSLRRAPSAR
ncbi:MAG: cohesin domain-containing protein [Steroidobacter sp.]